MKSESENGYDVAVVGGGLGGLSAVALVARRGFKVLLLEQGGELGGRARTRHEGGFAFNWGPHALYRGGPADRVLWRLDLEPPGNMVGGGGGYLLDGRTMQTLPSGVMSLLATRAFGAADKLAVARLLTRIPSLEASVYASTSVEDWITSLGVRSPVRRFLRTMVRLTTYAHAPEHMSASTAITQLQLALTEGVRYVDGGWETLVSMLERTARSHGVEIRRDARALRIEETPAPQVVLEDGTVVNTAWVMLAVPPSEAARLLPSEADQPLRAHLTSLVPIRAACLTVALSPVPNPATRIVLGVDRPLYLSNHSASADLGNDGSVFHLARYLGPNESADPEHAARDPETELEALLDRRRSRPIRPRVTSQASPEARPRGASS